MFLPFGLPVGASRSRPFLPFSATTRHHVSVVLVTDSGFFNYTHTQPQQLGGERKNKGWYLPIN